MIKSFNILSIMT